MLANAFIGKPKKPNESELAAELGASKALWDNLVIQLAQDHGIDVQEWKSYSLKAGWTLRLNRKKRAIVYLSPLRGCFRASFALGDKAIAAAKTRKLPASVMKTITEAKRYPEGTAVRIEVKKASDVSNVCKLAALKLEF